MKFIKYLVYLVVWVILLIIGIATGYSPGQDLNGFFSFLFIGLWCSLSVEYFARVKKNHEFLASQNQFVLIFGALFIGTFYGFWGDFTPIIRSEVFSTNINLNYWHLVFSLPYLFIGSWLLFLCVKKYFYVYVGEKAIGSRGIAIVLSVLFVLLDLMYFLFQGGLVSLPLNQISPETTRFNILIFIHFLSLLGILIYSLLTKGMSTSRLGVDRVANRLNDIDRQIEDANRVAGAARQRELAAQNRERELQLQQRRDAERKKREDQQRRKREQQRQQEIQRQREKQKSQQPVRSKSSSSTRPPLPSDSAKSKSSKKSNLRKIKALTPQTGILTEDDFKCIFCFELPTSSEKHRGIVLCPNCNYPAHEDEFRTWVRSSTLCSRCDGEIPASFRRNPKVISAQDYQTVIKYWKKRKYKL